MLFYSKHIRPQLLKYAAANEKWCAAHLSIRARVIVVCIITGILAGVGAWLLKSMIRGISLSLVSGLGEWKFNWILFAAPAIGLILCGLLQRRVFHRTVSRGTDRLRKILAAKQYDMPHQLTYQPVIGCALTVGMGGSAGAEGPIAYAGGAIGSNAARFFGLERKHVRMMIGFGAAAGIAAIFKSPLGGVFFTLEVLGMTLTTVPVLGLIACCLLSAFTAYALSGFTPDILWQGAVRTFDYTQFGWLLLIGILLGLYCRWYTSSGKAARAAWLRMPSPLLRSLIAGIFLGALIFLLPTLYGEGYGSLQKVLAGNLNHIADYSPFHGFDSKIVIPLMLAGILLVKGAAVFTTNNAGGVAGSFAPTLFAGCMAGALLAFGTDALGCTLPHSQIAYICMAGAMAGIVRAPFMATFITVEASMTYELLLPVATVALVSYLVATCKTGKILCHIRVAHEL